MYLVKIVPFVVSHLVFRVRAVPTGLSLYDDLCYMELPKGMDCKQYVDCRRTYAGTANFGDENTKHRRDEDTENAQGILALHLGNENMMDLVQDLIERNAILWDSDPHTNVTSGPASSANNTETAISPRATENTCCRPTTECYNFIRTTGWYAEDKKHATPIADPQQWRQAFCCVARYMAGHPRCPDGGSHQYDGYGAMSVFWRKPPLCSDDHRPGALSGSYGLYKKKIFPVYTGPKDFPVDYDG